MARFSGPLIATLAAVLAGCAGAEGTPANPATTSDGAAPPATGSSGTLVPAPPLVLHDVEISVAATSPGFDGPTPACDPTNPQACGFVMGQPIIPALPTPFNGTFYDHAHLYFGAIVGERALTGVFVFTGSIDGCTGSGTATFPWVAAPDMSGPVAPNTSGEVVHGHDYLSAPTNTTGFALIDDAELDYEYEINPVTGVITNSMLTGTISCK